VTAELYGDRRGQIAEISGRAHPLLDKRTLQIVTVSMRRGGLGDPGCQFHDCVHTVKVRVTTHLWKCKICTMKSYGEYCPIAMGSDAIADRWTPLILREFMCGAERFSDIHRGIPRMSRSLLAQRLRQMERLELIERHPGPTYRLSSSGRELEEVIWALGDWAMRWLLGDPEENQLDGAHLMWRVHQRVITENLPAQRTVVQFHFSDAKQGKTVWLVLDPAGATVCERDEGFDVDLFVEAQISYFLKVWMGRGTWRQAQDSGALTLRGPRNLVRAFPTWFALSPFAHR
jgi:DNA-binding HxlR family transcriptional regulator